MTVSLRIATIVLALVVGTIFGTLAISPTGAIALHEFDFNPDFGFSTSLWKHLSFSGDALVVQRSLLCCACLFFDIFVLAYHYTNPPHPKFVMDPRRRWSLRLHVLGGSLEIFFGTVALVTGWTSAATCMALSALCLHIPTSFFQTTALFGVRVVMIPGYVVSIMLHAYTALRVLAHPDVTELVVSNYLVLHTYVFVRVFYAFYSNWRAMNSMVYTMSVLTAGVITFSSVLGPFGPIYLFGSVILFNFVYSAANRAFGDNKDLLHAELDRETITAQCFNADEHDVIPPTLAQLKARGKTKEELARMVFAHIDKEGNGYIELREVQLLLEHWGIPIQEADKIILANDRNGDGRIGFDEFFSQLRPVWRYGAAMILRWEQFRETANPAARAT